MTATLGIVLAEGHAIRSQPEPRVGLVLLERTFYDPPRRAAMVRWVDEVRRAFPAAELVPYAWHLVTHGPEDGAREHATRTLSGPAYKFGSLQATAQTEQAWEVTQICREVCGSDRVVIRTPPSLTPGALGRRRLAKFAQTRKVEGVDLIWAPSGLWETPEAMAVGREIAANVMLPAFEGGRPRYAAEGSLDLVHPDAWLGVTTVGARQNLSGDQVDALTDHLFEHPDAVLIFSGRRSLGALRAVVEALEA